MRGEHSQSDLFQSGDHPCGRRFTGQMPPDVRRAGPEGFEDPGNSQGQRGLSDARNEGVRHASGKYLLFVDSDDYISRELVSKTVKAARDQKCDIVLFDYYCVEDGVQEIRSTDLPAGKVMNLDTDKELLLAPPSAWTKLFDREFYMSSGCTFPVGRYFEDLAVTPLLFLAAERIVYVKEPLYYYMIRENSIMTGKNYRKSCEDKLAVLDHILRSYRERKSTKNTGRNWNILCSPTLILNRPKNWCWTGETESGLKNTGSTHSGCTRIL